ncbi:hypothetical protein AKO1_014270 [Acrasis kona]|uniref:SAGA-associated factor 11 n=1 Tax=Acrasis kona TaxID=1008807 RepID=A0AAW2YZX8_9EUKA
MRGCKNYEDRGEEGFSSNTCFGLENAETLSYSKDNQNSFTTKNSECGIAETIRQLEEETKNLASLLPGKLRSKAEVNESPPNLFSAIPHKYEKVFRQDPLSEKISVVRCKLCKSVVLESCFQNHVDYCLKAASAPPKSIETVITPSKVEEEVADYDLELATALSASLAEQSDSIKTKKSTLKQKRPENTEKQDVKLKKKTSKKTINPIIEEHVPVDAPTLEGDTISQQNGSITEDPVIDANNKRKASTLKKPKSKRNKNDTTQEVVILNQDIHMESVPTEVTKITTPTTKKAPKKEKDPNAPKSNRGRKPKLITSQEPTTLHYDQSLSVFKVSEQQPSAASNQMKYDHLPMHKPIQSQQIIVPAQPLQQNASTTMTLADRKKVMKTNINMNAPSSAQHLISVPQHAQPKPHQPLTHTPLNASFPIGDNYRNTHSNNVFSHYAQETKSPTTTQMVPPIHQMDSINYSHPLLHPHSSNSTPNYTSFHNGQPMNSSTHSQSYNVRSNAPPYHSPINNDLIFGQNYQPHNPYHHAYPSPTSYHYHHQQSTTSYLPNNIFEQKYNQPTPFNNIYGGNNNGHMPYTHQLLNPIKNNGQGMNNSNYTPPPIQHYDGRQNQMRPTPNYTFSTNNQHSYMNNDLM